MPRRLRVGPASGPQVLGVLAAVVLVVALLVTGRSLSGNGTPPSAQPTPTADADRRRRCSLPDRRAAGLPARPAGAGHR